MSWKKLDIDDLRKILSEDEVAVLATIGVPADVENMVNDVIDVVADTWRGAIIGKGYAYDVRDHYVPGTYAYWVLVHARWALWTRFPHSPSIALDEARKDEYEKALEILEKCALGTSKPDYEHSSDNPENKAGGTPSVVIPFLRFDEQLMRFGELSAI